MNRKLYLAAIIQDAEESGEIDVSLIDPSEALISIDDDWAHDTGGGKHFLERGDFHAAWFQLTDMSTQTVEAEEYVHFIRQLLSLVRVPVETQPAVAEGQEAPPPIYEWREHS